MNLSGIKKYSQTSLYHSNNAKRVLTEKSTFKSEAHLKLHNVQLCNKFCPV